MIQLLGIGENIELELREQLSISQKHIGEKLEALINVCHEAVILSTCNRIEIYFNSDREDENCILELFKVLDWDINMRKHFLYLKSEEAVKHLMEVACGFHSKVLGEEQILGQIKNAFETAVNFKAADKELYRLFQTAITCGKEFRDKSELYKIPVSSSSIAVKIAREKAARNFMILGFGDVGELTLKYIQSGVYDNIYVAVRNIENINIDDSSIKVLPFSERRNYYEMVECIISCTSAPHTVIRRQDLPDKELIIFDLAVPRDVEQDVCSMENIEVYDIDTIGLIDNENCIRRENIMQENRYIVEDYIEQYMSWLNVRDISGYIERLQQYGDEVYKQRLNTFKNKKTTKDNDKLAEILLKSTSNAFVNRAIEVLKEEKMKGSAEECMRIMGKIFCLQD
jgi:glutamyl-tRNA reductase